MKRRGLQIRFLGLITACVLAGCATQPEPPSVRVGMTREDLRFYFGEPLRIQAADSGKEDWYYRFVCWSTPTEERTMTFEEGAPTVAVTSSTSWSKEERPIHLSADGHVIEPLPEGKPAGR